MGNEITQGLPQEVQSATQGDSDTLGAGAAADASRPVIPGTRMPVPPTEAQPAPAAPDISTGSLADKLAAAFASHLANFRSTPTAPSVSEQSAPPEQQQSFASKLAGAGGALAAGLGDAAAANNGGKGGWLGAVARTLNARDQRIQNEKQIAFDQQERKRMDDINYAHAQTQIMLAQQSLRHADYDFRQKALAQDKDTASQMDEVGTPIVARNLDSSQIKTWLQDKSNQDMAHKVTAVIDHYLPEDENGYARPVYTLYGEVPESIALSEKDAQLLTDFGPSGQKYAEGSKVPGSSYIRVLAQAKSAQAADAARQKLLSEIYKNDEEGMKANEANINSAQLRAIEHDPGFIATMNAHGYDPLSVLDAEKNIQKDPKASPEQKQAAGKLAANVVTYFGSDALGKMQHNRADEALKAQENALKAQEISRIRKVGM